MFRIAVVGVAGIFISSFPAFALCTSYPNTLTNGTTADAGQVMANFNCAVLTSGATIGGATLTGTTGFPGSGAITSTGSLGIGTSSPDEKLSVSGAIRILSNANNWNTSASGVIDYYSNNLRITAGAPAATNNGITFTTTNSGTNVTAMQFLPNGHVLLGTGADYNANLASFANSATVSPGYFEQDSTANSAMTTVAGSASYAYTMHHMYTNTSPGTGFNFMDAQASSSVVFRIIGNGNVVNANNSYGSISDIREKRLYHRMESVIDKFRAVEFWDYHFRSERDANPLRHGVIAQYVEKQFPWLVSEGPWGSPKNIRKTVDYMGLSIVTARATQENVIRVDQARADLAKLSARVAELQGAVAGYKTVTDRQAGEIDQLRIQLTALGRSPGIRTARR